MTRLRAIVFCLAIMFPTCLSKSYIDKHNQNEIYCLSLAIYMEARGEHLRGQFAVANVILNRANKAKDNICVIIAKQGQFSWHGKAKLPTRDMLAASLPVAYDVFMSYNGEGHVDDTFGATHFSGKHVNNYWTKKMRRLKTIGKHSFYGEK